MRNFLHLAAITTGLISTAAALAQDALPQPGTPARQPSQAPPPAATPGAAPVRAPGPPDEATYRQQTSYALGRNFAENLRQNEIECNLEFLVAGISDVLREAQPKWSEAELESAMSRFAQEMQQKTVSRMQRQAGENDKKAVAFLAQNAKREGVQTTPSGLQYRVIKQGTGASPTLNDRVRCNYRGMLIDGTEFDSSSQHGGPVEFGVDGVIPGWTEALQKMKVGDKWQLFVPPKLAYGVDPPGAPIQPNSLLVFDIELLEIVQP